MKQLDLIWTARASEELADIIEGIYRASGHRRTADRYREKILTTASRIAFSPEAGRARDDLASGVRTWIFERRLIIVYRILAGQVRILRVVDGRRDYRRLFAGEAFT